MAHDKNCKVYLFSWQWDERFPESNFVVEIGILYFTFYFGTNLIIQKGSTLNLKLQSMLKHHSLVEHKTTHFTGEASCLPLLLYNSFFCSNIELSL